MEVARLRILYANSRSTRRTVDVVANRRQMPLKTTVTRGMVKFSDTPSLRTKVPGSVMVVQTRSLLSRTPLQLSTASTDTPDSRAATQRFSFSSEGCEQ